MTDANESEKPGGNCSECICDGKGPAITKMLKMMLPNESTGEHFKNASMEVLKGLRDMLDQKIEAMGGQQSKGTKFGVD